MQERPHTLQGTGPGFGSTSPHLNSSLHRCTRGSIATAPKPKNTPRYNTKHTTARLGHEHNKEYNKEPRQALVINGGSGLTFRPGIHLPSPPEGARPTPLVGWRLWGCCCCCCCCCGFDPSLSQPLWVGSPEESSQDVFITQVPYNRRKHTITTRKTLP